jgi:hypothetical protein
LSLKQVLAKQPGPGLREELTKTQQALKNRGDQLNEKRAQKIQKLAYESSRDANQYHNKQNGAQVKYTGGGFRMSVQSITSFD